MPSIVTTELWQQLAKLNAMLVDKRNDSQGGVEMSFSKVPSPFILLQFYRNEHCVRLSIERRSWTKLTSPLELSSALAPILVTTPFLSHF